MTKHASDPQIDDLIATMAPKKTLPPYERRFLVWLVIVSMLLIGIMSLTGLDFVSPVKFGGREYAYDLA